MLFPYERAFLVADSAALAYSQTRAAMDADSLHPFSGYREYRNLGVPVFCRAADLSELCSSDQSAGPEPTERSGGGGGVYVGVWVYGLSNSGFLDHDAAAGSKPWSSPPGTLPLPPGGLSL